jgi:nucleoside-diphosphate-sugar epimerase
MRGRALVAGALGIVGRNMAEHLSSRGDWEVFGISRGVPKAPASWQQGQLDLTDAAACRSFVECHPGITHLFYAARAPLADAAAEARLNLQMLANILGPLEGSAAFRHVCLVHGSKWYGSHLGPFVTPAREEQPAHLPPNFYFDQLACVTSRQPGSRWTWSAVRPAVVCGFALGYPHNIVAVIGVYATLLKALGLPLLFPGSQRCFDAVSQATDAQLLARAMEWFATEPHCANESFNVINGDLFRWRHLWPRIAAHFGMEAAGVQTVPLATLMADKEALWQSIVERHGLQPLALSDIVNWSYADQTFRQDWDHISCTLKARRFGFHDCIDSEQMFLAQIDRFRAERILP